MAHCHLRSCLYKQTKILSTRAFLGRFYLENPRAPCNISVTSLFKDHHQHSSLFSNKRESTLTRTALLESSQFRYLHFSRTVLYSNKEKGINGGATDANDKVESDKKTDAKSETVPEEKLTVFQRFKKTYKEHGKVLVCVHLLTSAVWFGSFFYAAKVGVDVIPLMEWIGLPDKVINPFRNSSLGDVALAYLMYKLATPARYTVTLTGTNFAIKYLRKVGKMQPKDKSSSLRVLAKDSRAELKVKRRKMQGTTDQIKSNLIDRRVKVKDRIKKLRVKLKRQSNLRRFRQNGIRKAKPNGKTKK